MLGHALRPDLIITDMHMPGMDGLEATQTIKQRFGRAAPPIIALTADAAIEDRARCEAAGMDDFLTKPLQVVELTRSLARWTQALSPEEHIRQRHLLLPLQERWTSPG